MAKNKKIVAESDLYTAILALAFLISIAALAFISTKCYLDYETLFKIAGNP